MLKRSYKKDIIREVKSKIVSVKSKIVSVSSVIILFYDTILT